MFEKFVPMTELRMIKSHVICHIHVVEDDPVLYASDALSRGGSHDVIEPVPLCPHIRRDVMRGSRQHDEKSVRPRAEMLPERAEPQVTSDLPERDLDPAHDLGLVGHHVVGGLGCGIEPVVQYTEEGKVKGECLYEIQGGSK